MGSNPYSKILRLGQITKPNICYLPNTSWSKSTQKYKEYYEMHTNIKPDYNKDIREHWKSGKFKRDHHFILVKTLIYLENIIVMNLYMSNNIALTHLNKKC